MTEELVDLVRRDPGAVAIFSDFDGTLAPIVAHPPDARALPESLAALAQLARSCRVAAVISGRPLSFLDPFLPSEVRLAGLYGLEQRIDGQYRQHPAGAAWGPVVTALVARAVAELPPSAVVEHKSLSLTLHYRADPAIGPEVSRWAGRAATASGLERRAAKMSVELHPPVAVDKGTTLRAWAEGAGVVAFAGDDLGDLAAFAVLGELRRAGVRTFALAVGGPESPPEVLAAADEVLAGPAQLASLLEALAAAAS